MLMDVIIDPIAFRGDQWFLGKIYFYREPGEYFHIPLTNFAGWFFVSAATLTCFAAFNSLLDRKIPLKTKQIAGQALLGPGLYFGVLTMCHESGGSFGRCVRDDTSVKMSAAF